MIRYLSFAFLLSVSSIHAADGNRLTYLDESSPYYVHGKFPRLTTDQWVGEKDVNAVVILSIDDMRDPEKYEKFLRPILNRLKKIDGRAPVSIMTCKVDPKHAQLQAWLKEGLSLETHTIDHPCPLLAGGDLKKAKKTYDDCVDLLASIPGNKPVAFRTPCCDSLNTASPRLFAEIFNKKTPQGKFLEIDSSVFNVFTKETFPDVPDRFLKYLPRDRSYVGWVENYPYPYIVNKFCWEFPCATPSDWQAQHLHGKNSPITLRDWKAALDRTVDMRGVMPLVFHPHGWIESDAIVQLIDHAVETHGSKVKFLTFKDCRERLTKNLLHGTPLRAEDGSDNGVRLMDLNEDGIIDVVIGNGQSKKSFVWGDGLKRWYEEKFPLDLTKEPDARFGVLMGKGSAVGLRPVVIQRGQVAGAWIFNGDKWVEDKEVLNGLEIDGKPILFSEKGIDRGVRLRDLDRDGYCELIVGNDKQNAVFEFNITKNKWERLPFSLPAGTAFVDAKGRDLGLRFLDLDDDGYDDILFANEKDSAAYFFSSMKDGWSTKLFATKGGDDAPLPPITRAGTDNGFWAHSRSLWYQNEDTAHLSNHVNRRSFDELLKDANDKPRSPEHSKRLLVAHRGFEVELMATEPDVRSPVAFAWGYDLRLWVAEMGDYPLGVDGKGKKGGRVVVLDQPRKGERYTGTVFLENLPFPTGIMPWRKGVLITAAPDILYAEDFDGDGKAEKIEVLFTGFGQGNQQHRVNTLAWGLDNWIYGANGDSGGKIKSMKTGKVVDISGRDFRFRPDDGAFEAVTGTTQFGRCRDDWGNWFGNNNANPLWHYVLDDAYLKRNKYIAPPTPRVHVPDRPGASRVYPLSVTLPRFNDPHTANHFTSACSPAFYRDTLFGPEFAGNVFISEPVHNLVHREVLKTDGVTFTGNRPKDEQSSEFLASRDNWFRPTMIQTGPDGALWVADMYRHVIEHPQWIPADWQKKLDLRAGHDRGRIYRVLSQGRKRDDGIIRRRNNKKLVEELESPNGWRRDTAQMLLIWDKDPEVIPLLKDLVTKSPSPLARLHALCTLDGLDAITPILLRRVFRDEHPGVRRHAVRIAEHHLKDVGEFAREFIGRADDTDPHVRLQMAYVLGAWKDPRAGELLGRMAADNADDKFILAAIFSSVTGPNLEAMMKALLSSRKTLPPGNVVDTLLRLATSFEQPRAVAALLGAIATPDTDQYAPWQFAALVNFLDVFEARQSTLEGLALEADEGVQESLKKVEALFVAARTVAGDEKAAPADRAAAASLLGRGKTKKVEDAKLLASLLGPRHPDEVQRAAVATLGRAKEPKTLQVLLDGWKSYSPTLRAAVLDVLLARDEGTNLLLAAMEKKDVAPGDFDLVRRQRLQQHRTASIRDKARKLFTETIDADRRKVLDAYQKVLTLKGDSGRGKPLYVKHCAACHRLAGLGNDVGPDLASVPDRSPQALLVAVLDPNRALEARYQQYIAETRGGMFVTGVLTAETSTSVTLVPVDGKPITLLRKDLDSLTSTGKSPMPEGFEKELKEDDLADLFAFVRGAAPAPARKTIEGNKPELIRVDKDGVLVLKAANAEIYGPTLVFEKQHGNLGWWASADDHAVWEIEVPKAGKYAINLDWSCQESAAGNRFQLLSGEAKLTGTVVTTGTWDDYKQEKIGILDLREGRQRITFRSEGAIRKGALIDLRSLKLTPQPK